MATAKQNEMPTVKVYRNKGCKTSEVYNDSILKIENTVPFPDISAFFSPRHIKIAGYGRLERKGLSSISSRDTPIEVSCLMPEGYIFHFPSVCLHSLHYANGTFTSRVTSRLITRITI